jgi:hypothetical protein
LLKALWLIEISNIKQISVTKIRKSKQNFVLKSFGQPTSPAYSAIVRLRRPDSSLLATTAELDIGIKDLFVIWCLEFVFFRQNLQGRNKPPSFHHSFFCDSVMISMTILPYSSTCAEANGGTTKVEEYSTTTTGPLIRFPLFSFSLAIIFVGTR